MSRERSSLCPAPGSYGRKALLAWFAALALCLIGLIRIVCGSSAISAGRDEVKVPLALDATDPGTVWESLPAPGTVSAPGLPFDAAQEYVLVGAGLQGFCQNSAPDDVWTLAYATPQLNAQLVKRGPPSPQIVTDGVNVTWELDPQAGLTAGNFVRQGKMKAEDSWFQASIAVNFARADSQYDPYPVVRLRAEDEKSGRLLAQSAAVLAVAPGFGCAHCHENGGTAILEVHDRHQGTALLAQHAQGKVVACRSCHDGLTVDQTGKARAGKGLSISAAVHGWHAVYLADNGADACMTCHVALSRVTEQGKSEIRPLFARDFHGEFGLTCVRCHGLMEDHSLVLLKAELEAGQTLAASAMKDIAPREMPLDKMKPRLPWRQEPDCDSCHNFSEAPDPLTATAFNKWTSVSDGMAGLFSERRDDMFMVRCLVCHGAPHAVYPARNPVAAGLDNMPPVQYQNLAAPLGSAENCAVCHGEAKDFFAHHPLADHSQAEKVEWNRLTGAAWQSFGSAVKE